jgi:hypothetical protein
MYHTPRFNLSWDRFLWEHKDREGRISETDRSSEAPSPPAPFETSSINICKGLINISPLDSNESKSRYGSPHSYRDPFQSVLH